MTELKAFIFIQLSRISILIHTLRTQPFVIILKIFIDVLDHFYINLNVLLNGRDISNEKFFIYFSIVRYNCGNWKMLHGRVIKFHSFTTGTKCSSAKNQIFSGQDFPVDEEWCWSDTNWLVKIQRWFLIFQIW